MSDKDFQFDIRHLTKSEWVSVKDRLPAEKSSFLGTDGEIVFAAYWVQDCNNYKVGGWEESCYYCGGSSLVSFLDKDKIYCAKKVTHWMPLPEPPKEE